MYLGPRGSILAQPVMRNLKPHQAGAATSLKVNKGAKAEVGFPVQEGSESTVLLVLEPRVPARAPFH